jgi:amidase
MNRRNFIKITSLNGFVLSPVLFSSCRNPPSADETNTVAIQSTPSFELEEATIPSLQEAMASGRYTARSITELYLQRIEAIDKNGYALNSVIELNPDALSIADALDKERSDGNVRGPLHGIPILIKDNIDTGDKMMTTAGSLALEGHRANSDAFIIEKLRGAGAVILGKTNLSEWANFRSERSSSGWSSRGGQTRNPYASNRNPCGSSSGSGAAVAANLCVAAIGTETNGSIACPSSINGIVGIKPTVGLLNRSGIIPISHTQDTAGPMTRTVQDAAILLSVMTRADSQDKATALGKNRIQTDYTKFLISDGLKGKRIGVEKSYLKVHEGVDTLFGEAIAVMKQQGAEVIEVDFLEKVKGINAEEFLVLQYEFKDGLNRYLASAGATVRSLKDVIDFNNKNADRVMPYFRQEIMEKSEALGSLESEEYKNALNKILNVTRKGIDDTLQSLRLDAICGPTNGPSWCTDLVNGDFFTGYGMYSPAAIAGYPHITVPMGLVKGLPVGLTFFSKAFDEPQLITVAFAFEQASKKRVPPTFRETL